ncbi:NUDIX hydrolase [Sulfolobales archaeon HS-7]|nr:NUDIX hydrolase [Sulfolobales archaeon HS-7]
MRVFSGSKFGVDVEEVVLPNGKRKRVEKVTHPGSVVIMANFEGKIVLEKQFRPVIGKWIFELPAGTIDEGESPEQAAIRELREETGLVSSDLKKLLDFYPSPGISNEIMHVFLANNCEKGDQALEDYEVIELVPLEREQILSMIREGKIEDGKTIASLLYFFYMSESLQ